MAEFAYKALDKRKQFVSGHLQALSLNAAVEQLIEFGYVPLSTAPSYSHQATGWRRLLPQTTVSKREVTVLLLDLALLLRSGLSLDDGLRLLTDNASGALAKLIERLRRIIGSGGTFADALRSQPETALPDLIAIVKSAEAAGNLEQALSAVAQERLKQEKVTAKVRAAVRYPIFLLLVSMSVLVFFLVFVIPQFAGVVHDFGAQPDALVTTVIAISDGLRNNGTAIAVSGILLTCSVLFIWRVQRYRSRLIGIISEIPGLRGVIVLRRTTMFCRGLAILLGNSVTLTDALRLLSEAHLGDPRLKVISDHIRRGGRLVDSITETNFLSPPCSPDASRG